MELFSSQSKAFTFEIVQFSDCDTSQETEETLSISFWHFEETSAQGLQRTELSAWETSMSSNYWKYYFQN